LPQLEKLKTIHNILEDHGRLILTNNFDIKSTLTAIIVILKEMVEFEIEKQKAPTSPYT